MNKAERKARLVDAIGGGVCLTHGEFIGTGQYHLRACPKCDIEAYFSEEKKETGIIMSGDHPVKIMNGTKTMTRRLWGLKEINEYPDAWEHVGHDKFGWFGVSGGKIFHIRCPYGGVGDLLWVRETYAVRTDGVDQILYKADYVELVKMLDLPEFNIKWKPSIHMFRKDSRITREIKGLRAERLQMITNEDAKAEGVTPMTCCLPGAAHYITPFKNLWDSINPKYPWEMNPWVWVISF